MSQGTIAEARTQLTIIRMLRHIRTCLTIAEARIQLTIIMMLSSDTHAYAYHHNGAQTHMHVFNQEHMHAAYVLTTSRQAS